MGRRVLDLVEQFKVWGRVLDPMSLNCVQICLVVEKI